MNDGRADRSEESEVEADVVRYLDEYVSGRKPDKAAYLARFRTAEAREDFEELLRYAITVQSFPPESLQSGSMLGPYRIESRLGSGGFGTVWRARDTNLDRDVAIKILPPEKSRGAEIEKRLELESRVLARLNHPGIVPVHAAGQVEGASYLVMDFVDGVSLDTVIERLVATGKRRLSGADLLAAIGKEATPGRPALFGLDTDYHVAVARIVLGVTRAIEAAHALGVVHRDLKPANVMLTGGGHPVVLDFGLASGTMPELGAVTEGLVGTVPYMAPEQVSAGRTGRDARTDIYQLGMLLYELLVLRRAFPQESIDAVLQAIRYGRCIPPRRLAHVPAELDAICTTAIEPDPGRRFASAAAMAEDLERWLDGRPITSRRPSLWRLGQLAARRNHRALVAAAAAASLGVLVWLCFPRRETTTSSMSAFVLPVDGPGEPRQGATEVAANQIIGLTIDLPARATLYAVSLAGRRYGEPEYLNALRPTVLADAAAGRFNESFALTLGTGTHAVACSHVDGKKDEKAAEWFEGLWVFVVDSEQAWIRHWLADLDAEREARPEGPGVPLVRARALMAGALEPKRGGTLKGLTPAQIEALKASVQRGELGTSGAWPLDNPKPQAIWLKLR